MSKSFLLFINGLSIYIVWQEIKTFYLSFIFDQQLWNSLFHSLINFKINQMCVNETEHIFEKFV
jgi:hypothetical protein